MKGEEKRVEEKLLHPKSGMVMLSIWILVMVIAIVIMVGGGILYGRGTIGNAVLAVSEMIGAIVFTGAAIAMAGLKILNPNEAIVFALFGKYYGTIKKEGFFWVNPFCTAINPSTRNGMPVMTAKGSSGKSEWGISDKKVSLRR